jgi:hypothetical protein
MALRSTGLEEIEAAQRHLAQSILRLKERRLRRDLEALKNAPASDQPELLHLVQQKIQALSRLLKMKEGTNGQS